MASLWATLAGKLGSVFVQKLSATSRNLPPLLFCTAGSLTCVGGSCSHKSPCKLTTSLQTCSQSERACDGSTWSSTMSRCASTEDCPCHVSVIVETLTASSRHGTGRKSRAQARLCHSALSSKAQAAAVAAPPGCIRRPMSHLSSAGRVNRLTNQVPGRLLHHRQRAQEVSMQPRFLLWVAPRHRNVAVQSRASCDEHQQNVV